MKLKYLHEVQSGLISAASHNQEILSEADLACLPEPVSRYIRFSGAVGKPKVNNFKVEFSGKIRKNVQSPWMPFTVEQHSFIQESTRLFWMDARMMHLPVKGFHCFKRGVAFMDIRLFSLFRVQFMDGQEMGIAETVTFFNDLCVMAPAALTDKRIKWIEVYPKRVLAEYTDNGITVSAWLHFGDKDELVNFVSDDRFELVDGKMIRRTWQTPVISYHEIKGHRLCKDAELIYSHPEGDFCYGKFEMTDLKYNCKKNV